MGERARARSATLRRRRTAGWLIAALGTLVAAGLTGGEITGSPAAASAAAAATTGAATTAHGACSIEAVVKRDLPSVVTITATAGKSVSTGSGELIDRAGHVLTNNHVIAVAASRGGRVSVLFSDGRSFPATIEGRDPATDLAVLTVRGEAGVPPIPMGSSSDLQVGETVVVLGSPLGLSGTVTSGIVSALGRTIAVPGEGSSSALLVNAIQTDAAINPGNSGGALVNCAAQLVGIPSAGATVPLPSGGSSAGSIGLGFAIPIEMARTVAAQLIATGHVRHADIGLEASPVPDANGAVQGLYVDSVAPAGPAAKAGLQAGDLLTRIGGVPATSPDQLNAMELTLAPGSKVVFVYRRAGRTEDATVVLAGAA